MTNNRRWGDNSQKNFLQGKLVSKKKMLRAVIRKTKMFAEEATCIAFKVVKSMG